MPQPSLFDRRKSAKDFAETTWLPRVSPVDQRKAKIRRALDEIQENRALAQVINDPLYSGDQK